MYEQLEFATIEISDRELDRLLDAAEEYCRRGAEVEIERRHRERFLFNRDVTIHRSNNAGEILGVPVPARARDISLWGISLSVQGSFARHDRLAVDLTIPQSGDKDRRARMLVEVRYTKPEPPGEMILGCAFRESLDPDTMERAISGG